MSQSQQPRNPLFVGIGLLAIGLILLGIFAIRPMVQVTQHVNGITLSFKAILLGAFCTTFALNMVLLGGKGIPWKRDPGIPLTRLQIVATIVSGVLAMGIVAIVMIFFSMHGYGLTL